VRIEGITDPDVEPLHEDYARIVRNSAKESARISRSVSSLTYGQLCSCIPHIERKRKSIETVVRQVTV
jgi:hypothetical protein